MPPNKKRRQKSRPAVHVPFTLDWWLLLPVLALMALGLLMVASASMVVSEHSFSSPYYFVIRHSIYLVIALVVLVTMSRIPGSFWQQNCFLLLGVSFLLLVVVLIPGIGREINGSRRWIGLPFFTFQVSEFVKWVVIIFMANYISRHASAVRQQLDAFIRPLILLAGMVLLLLMQPDFGTVAVILLTTLSLLFLAGSPLRPFFVIVLLVGAALLALIWFSPYRFARLVSFLDPWSKQFGSGYQLTQSLIAFGRGGISGVGLGNSTQKLFYLPEAHTDFLFAVLGEELGLIGAIATLLVYVLLVARLFWWAGQLMRSQQLFPGYFCYGVGLWIALQAVINAGVTVGLLPTKGLTLPFISYGGTSLVIFAAAIGVVLRMVAENRPDLSQKGGAWKKNQQRK